ncbi:MAG: hypothetical protein AB1765_00140 [Candidatus Hydrogenedentota bacterium]
MRNELVISNERKFALILFISILGLGLFVRSVFVSCDIEHLLTIIPDDAFYYFKIAYNIISNKGSSLDGINLTNGYHPLWMIIILPFADLIKNEYFFIRVIICICIFLNYISALYLYLLLKKIVDKWYIPLTGLLLYYFNPRIIIESLNGLETSLSNLIFIYILYYLVAYYEKLNLSRYKIIFGILLGLLFLSRTDNVFYIISYFFIYLFLSGRDKIRNGFFIFIVFIAVTLLWFIWNLIKFRTIFQSSTFTIPSLDYVLIFEKNGYFSRIILTNSLIRFTDFFNKNLGHFLGFNPLPYTFFMCITIFSIVARWGVASALIRKYLMCLISLLIAGLVLIFLHTAIRWYPRSWYFNQFTILSVLLFLLSISLFDLKHILPSSQRLVGFLTASLVFLILFLSLLNTINHLKKGIYPWQVEMYDAARWLRMNVKRDERVGVFNAGIISFFSKRTVINLDGDINNTAYESFKEKELLEFMHRMSITYYLDYEPIMMSLYKKFFGEYRDRLKAIPIQVIDRQDVDWLNSKIKVYKLEWKDGIL